ncbi:hypothetical protein [Egibacter rhizosphaerae]|uniref:hypothetical protein n=1 Tax=Egibacter rhizosphaerae TaxID=1670831 RepID=UPI0013F15DE2|nr:hypothetical protein [Egibacter rhizosphaerae]
MAAMHETRERVTTAPPAVASTPPSLLRWNAVLGGAVLGLALFVLLMMLWAGLVVGAGIDDLLAGAGWYIGAAAAASMLAGAYSSGLMAGIGSPVPGLLNGLGVWATMTIVVAIVGPGAAAAFLPAIGDVTIATDGWMWWAPFIATLLGAIVAALGGMAGAASVPTHVEERELRLDPPPSEASPADGRPADVERRTRAAPEDGHPRDPQGLAARTDEHRESARRDGEQTGGWGVDPAEEQHQRARTGEPDPVEPREDFTGDKRRS